MKQRLYQPGISRIEKPDYWLSKAAQQTQTSVDLWFNKKWINYQMLEGKQIIDIGSGSVKEPSAFYNMERAQVEGYSRYVQKFQP